MKLTWLSAVLAFAAIASAVLGGVFFAFSDFVMRSLGKAQAVAGAEVMQIINREVFTSVFGLLLWGLLAMAVVLAGYASLHLGGRSLAWVVGGGVIYALGVGVVSAAFNVPMNHRLDAMDLAAAEAALYFKNSFVPDWTFWNHFRTLACVATAACYMMAGASQLRSP